MKNYGGNRGKVDANQPEIVEKLRAIGASVLITSSIKDCFDILVGFKGQTHIMEIKNPEYKPKTKAAESMLTHGEKKFKDEWKGSPYNIVFTFEEALDIINKTPNDIRWIFNGINADDLDKTIEILEQHQKWRRDRNVPPKVPQTHPVELGDALDHAIEELRILRI